MFDTVDFLWLHHDGPPYLLYNLEKLVDVLSDDRMRPPSSTTIRGCDWYQSIIQQPLQMCVLGFSLRCMEMQLL